jgi:hypothetical protein
MKKLRTIISALLLLPQPVWAGGEHAEVMMLPTRVVMESNDRYSTVVIKNVGNATGNFSVDLIDMDMQESGMVVPVEDGKTEPYSAIPYVRIAPRSMTLKAGEAQNVRLMLQKPEALEPGEYRAHLRVKIDNDNVSDNGQPVADTSKEVNIAVKTKLVLIIPVIFRHGETSYTIQIDAPKLGRDANGASTLGMYLLREGNRSSMGDISITYVSPDGKSQLMKFFAGVPVYRPTTKRFITVPLDVPKDINLSAGSLKITYATQEKEGSKVLAEKTTTLP